MKLHGLSGKLRKFPKIETGSEGELGFGFSVSEASSVCGSCGRGLVSRMGIEMVVPVFVPLVLVCEKAFGSWLSSRMALTLWSVLLLGLSAGLLVVIQLSLCLMKDFPMVLVSFGVRVSIAPSSFV